MAIYRTLYYTDVVVGVGGRVTIPQDMREDLGIDEGDSLTVRVEENPHGGRQMDMTMGAIEMLPEVVEAAKGQAEVYLDSGVRRGSDVIKALALGARAVGIGRPLFWGLAVNGAEGVHGVLELLREEVDRAMSYCGQTNIQELEPNLVNIPAGWGPGPISF